MATANFILIHGAWHGSWVWQRVAPELRRLNHNVYCPTLKGLGERVNELHKNIGLTDHINEICDFITANNLTNIFLVGHSYGGMVITGIADILPEKIAQLVYLDAVIPEPKQSLLDIFDENSGAYEKVVHFLPPKSAQEFGLETDKDISFATARYTKQPLKTFTEKINFSFANLLPIKKTYIACNKHCFDMKENKAFKNAAATAKNLGWNYFELNTGHSCMLTMPDELIAVFSSLSLR